ncbi:MAG: YbjN domain-containing protein [Cytophagaceae bacterium]
MQKTTREAVEAMVDQFVVEIGLTKQQTYNAERRAWYWTKGSAKIEVFIQEIKFETHSRFYLRIFSPIIKVPASNTQEFYRRLLEMNDTKLGLKLSIMPGSDQVYATFERDIDGIEYAELKVCIYDLEWWADLLDDELTKQYGDGGPAPR